MLKAFSCSSFCVWLLPIPGFEPVTHHTEVPGTTLGGDFLCLLLHVFCFCWLKTHSIAVSAKVLSAS